MQGSWPGFPGRSFPARRARWRRRPPAHRSGGCAACARARSAVSVATPPWCQDLRFATAAPARCWLPRSWLPMTCRHPVLNFSSSAPLPSTGVSLMNVKPQAAWTRYAGLDPIGLITGDLGPVAGCPRARQAGRTVGLPPPSSRTSVSAIAAAREGDAAGLRRYLRRFEAVTSAMRTVRHAVCVSAARVGCDVASPDGWLRAAAPRSARHACPGRVLVCLARPKVPIRRPDRL